MSNDNPEPGYRLFRMIPVPVDIVWVSLFGLFTLVLLVGFLIVVGVFHITNADIRGEPPTVPQRFESLGSGGDYFVIWRDNADGRCWSMYSSQMVFGPVPCNFTPVGNPK